MAINTESREIVGSLSFNHSDVRRVFNELLQKGTIWLSSPVEAYGNCNGWQCGTFTVHNSKYSFKYEPSRRRWYTTKKKAIASAYYETLMQFGMTDHLHGVYGPEPSTTCNNCKALRARILELEEQLKMILN